MVTLAPPALHGSRPRRCASSRANCSGIGKASAPGSAPSVNVEPSAANWREAERGPVRRRLGELGEWIDWVGGAEEDKGRVTRWEEGLVQQRGRGERRAGWFGLVEGRQMEGTGWGVGVGWGAVCIID